MSRFVGILLLLVGYTTFKAWQLWPQHRVVAMSLVIPIFYLMIGGMFLYRSYPTLIHASWFTVFIFVGGIIMSVWSTFIIFSIPIDVIHLMVHVFRKMSGPHDPERRAFISNGFRMGLLAVSGGMAGMGLIEMWRGPRTKKTDIHHAKFPKSLDGLHVVQISDLHVSSAIRKDYVQRVVEQTNALQPDLIFITGDLADGKIELMKEHLEPLKNLRAKHGIYYITGNHEYYWGANDFIALAKSYGFVPLVNENQIIQIQGSHIKIAGVTDPVGGNFLANHKPDLQKTFASVQKTDFNILLAHRPDTILEAEPLGYDLQFSGHTHGGQFFPFNFLTPIANKFWHGLNRHGNMQVYVNAGTGYWGPPNRFAISSEISSIRIFSEINS